MHGQQRWLPYPREGRQGGTQNLSALAHGFNDNGNAPTAVNNTATLLTSVTVTPQISGKFKLSASVVAHNPDDVNHTIGLQFGHAGAPDYPATANPVTIAVGGGSPHNAGVALEAETGDPAGPYTFVAPLGVPVTFDLFGTANVNGQVTVPANGAQLTVEELPGK